MTARFGNGDAFASPRRARLEGCWISCPAVMPLDDAQRRLKRAIRRWAKVIGDARRRRHLEREIEVALETVREGSEPPRIAVTDLCRNFENSPKSAGLRHKARAQESAISQWRQ